MNLLDVIKSNIQDFDNIELSPISDDRKIIRGWNCTSYLENGYALSTGTHSDKEIAIRICVAEALERSLFSKLCLEPNQGEFLINDFPTTCGFACGFDRKRTKHRSVVEALERWAWSQWVDSGCEISKLSTPLDLDDLSLSLLVNFEKCHFYLKDLILDGINYQFGVFLGFKKNGVFPGSRVCTHDESPWQHSIIEAYRNFNNFHFYDNGLHYEPSTQVTKTNFVETRNAYFGSNAISALAQIRLFSVDGGMPSVRT